MRHSKARSRPSPSFETREPRDWSLLGDESASAPLFRSGVCNRLREALARADRTRGTGVDRPHATRPSTWTNSIRAIRSKPNATINVGCQMAGEALPRRKKPCRFHQRRPLRRDDGLGASQHGPAARRRAARDRGQTSHPEPQRLRPPRRRRQRRLQTRTSARLRGHGRALRAGRATRHPNFRASAFFPTAKSAARATS